MKNHKKIGVVGILGHDEIEKIASELRQENVTVKPKTIDEIIKEEEAIKITMPYRINSYDLDIDLDIKTLLRYERSVIPPDFYNKRKKK